MSHFTPARFDGTGSQWAAPAQEARRIFEERAVAGSDTWADVILRDVFTVLAESDPSKLDAALAEVAATVRRWRVELETETETPFPYRQAPVSYAGACSERQSVGLPGHCEDCCSVGHVVAHPDLGCGDVGCTRAHAGTETEALA